MDEELKIKFEDCRKDEDQIICKAKLPEQCEANGKDVICKVRLK